MSVRVSSPPRATYPWRWVALASLLLAEAMNLLDSTIVQVATPAIRADLGGSASDMQWFSTAYTLPFALLLITGGRLGDIAGRRLVFRIGVAGFLGASLACALAGSVGMLICFRVVQGAAAAAIIPQTIGLIRAMFAGEEMSKALGSIGPVMGLAAVCGPILGGVLTQADLFGSSWRAAFLVNVPLCVAVLAVAPTLIEDHAPRRPSLDPVGTALAMLGTALIVYPLIGAGTAHMSTGSWVAIGLGLAAVLGFALQQRRRAGLGRSSLVETSLFAHRAFPAALVTSALFFAVTTGLMFVVVLHLQLGAGSDARTAGLTMAPWSVGLAVSSWVAGAYLVPRYGRRVMFAGLATLALGIVAAVAAYHAAAPMTYPTPLLGALGVAGLGVGVFTPSFFTAALKPLNPQEIGSAAGLLNAVQQLGATLGVAVLGSVYLDGSIAGSPGDAVQVTCCVAGGLLVASFLSAALMTAAGPRLQDLHPGSKEALLDLDL
ncbi:MFS transporter [Nonomuraea aurantiaca]|uniref:MFS transporter n=1 Tax=Nonomuraea aurantiaca TaxID=2878562 RepID=UPI001CDA1527|nr:MFS transporter [Nonomuraea aurantiaca]MCA2223878.1 MFS transporter [Nonomuraea aurantiaca]